MENFPIHFLFLAVALFGLFLGAFWNRLIERMPFEKSLRGKEICAHCERELSWFRALPLVGFFFFRRCPFCGKSTSLRRLIVEILTLLTALFSLIFSLFFFDFSANFSFESVSLFLIFSWLLLTLIPVCFIDFEHHLLPDTVSIGGIVLGFLVSFFPGGLSPWESALGAFIAGFGLWIFSKGMAKIVHKEAMGFGDVKLLSGYGALMGAPLAIEILIFASMLGVFIVLPVRMISAKAFALQSETSPGEFPFGPFLAIASPIVFLWGGDLLDFYLSLFVV